MAISYELTLIILIGAALWVYDDAKKRGMENAVGYAVLTFAFLIVGLPLYLHNREKHPFLTQAQPISSPPKPKVCPECRWANEASSVFCSKCGFKFPVYTKEKQSVEKQDLVKCSNCGKQYDKSNLDKCPECGATSYFF